MQTFKLFDKEVEIPLELSNFNVFRERYIKLADNARKEFAAKYKRFSNIEQVLDGYDNLCGELLDVIAGTAVSDLLANKVLDAECATIYDELCRMDRHGMLHLEMALEEIQVKFEGIIEDQQAKVAYRRARKQNRGKWVGGGFGVQGAVKGAVQAGAFNAVGGLAHGAANAVGNTLTAVGAGIRKTALFADPSTFATLEAAIYQDCQNILYALVNILKKNGMKIRAVTDEDADKAQVIFENIFRPGFPKGEILTALIQSILLYPYDRSCYQLMIERFGDKDNEVERFAAFFHVDVTAYKENKVRKHFADLPKTTLEEAIAARESVEKLCVSLGGVPNTVKKEIEQLIEDKKYQRLYEIYGGLPKDTLEQWQACKDTIAQKSKEMNIPDSGNKLLAEIETEIYKFKCGLADNFLSGLSKDSEAEAVEAKKKLEAYCSEIGLGLDNPAISKINEIIKRIDADIRTIEGHQFDSREAAQKAALEKKEIDALLGGRAPVSKKDFQLLLEYLDSHKITPELERIYRNRYLCALKRIEKLSKRALAFQRRQASRFHLIGCNKTGIIVHSVIYTLALLFSLATAGAGFVFTLPLVAVWETVKRVREKKAWKELTHGGQYGLLEILAAESDPSAALAAPSNEAETCAPADGACEKAGAPDEKNSAECGTKTEAQKTIPPAPSKKAPAHTGMKKKLLQGLAIAVGSFFGIIILLAVIGVSTETEGGMSGCYISVQDPGKRITFQGKTAAFSEGETIVRSGEYRFHTDTQILISYQEFSELYSVDAKREILYQGNSSREDYGLPAFIESAKYESLKSSGQIPLPAAAPKEDNPSQLDNSTPPAEKEEAAETVASKEAAQQLIDYWFSGNDIVYPYSLEHNQDASPEIDGFYMFDFYIKQAYYGTIYVDVNSGGLTIYEDGSDGPVPLNQWYSETWLPYLNRG